ncbi:hypothetical protein LQL77_29840 [Rhodococcus cerastii]|nr:hypothetical protein [Rhodococcus cerastii]
MNIRRHATILGIAAFGVASFFGTSVAHATETTPDVNLQGFDWGVNDNGWNVDLHNESDIALPNFAISPFSNIDSRTGNLGVHNTAHVHGKKSLANEGAANIDFEYQANGLFVPGISVKVTSSQVPDLTKTEMSVTATCTVNFSTDLGCKVQPAQINEPIQVVVYDKKP